METMSTLHVSGFELCNCWIMFKRPDYLAILSNSLLIRISSFHNVFDLDFLLLKVGALVVVDSISIRGDHDHLSLQYIAHLQLLKICKELVFEHYNEQ